MRLPAALAGLLLALAAAPAARAETLTAQAFWDLFAATCEAALAEPGNGAYVGTLAGAARAESATTPDGWGTQGAAVIERFEIGGAPAFLSLNYAVMRHAAQPMAFCTLQLVRPEGGGLPGIVEMLDARARDLVPDGTRHGGVIPMDDDLGQWIAWMAPDIAPDGVSLRTFGPVTMLTLNRHP